MDKKSLNGQVTRLENRLALAEKENKTNGVLLEESILRASQLSGEAVRLLQGSKSDEDQEELLDIEESMASLRIDLKDKQLKMKQKEVLTKSESYKPKLALVNIESFKGEISDWNRFLSIFLATIHNNDSMSDGLRFQYLVSYLEDIAKTEIKHLDLVSENHLIAINILKARFDDPVATAETLIKKFFSKGA
jgi:Protein of unknown function (DUF1759)